jgi:hypothetical protein
MDSTVCAKGLFLLSFLFSRTASIQKKYRGIQLNDRRFMALKFTAILVKGIW